MYFDLRCRQCDYSSFNENSLKRHLTSLLKKRCSTCAFVCMSKCDLDIHTTEVHTQRKVYLCVSCSKKLKTRTGLISHSRSQHNQPRFRCPDCAAPFPDYSSVVSHRKREHRDQVVTCSFCPYSCFSPARLKKHQQKCVLLRGKVSNGDSQIVSKNINLSSIEESDVTVDSSNRGCFVAKK